MKKTYCRFFIIILMSIASWASQGQTTKYYSTDKGLSSSFINKLYQDKKGFIWIATENGLNKFDGTKFLVYNKIQGDSTSLKSNYVRTLFEDSAGNFWIGCMNGLMKFNRDTETYTEVKIVDEKGSVQEPHIMSIIECKNGDIWFATSGFGLLSIKKGSDECVVETELNEKLLSVYLTVIYEDEQQNIWIGTEHSGLNVFNPATRKLIEYVSSDKKKDTFDNTSNSFNTISGNAISDICEGINGDIFIGILTDGLNRYNRETGDFERLATITGEKLFPVKSILFHKEENTMYIGTDGNGMKTYSADKQYLEEYEPFYFPFDFSKTKIHSILKDKDGNIWTGMFQKGIFFIPGNSNSFRYHGYKSIKNNNIGSSCIMSIYKDSDEVLWIGTDYDGLYSINEKTNEVRHYHISNKKNEVPNTIMCIEEHNGGQLWLGSYLNGFYLFDKKTGKCIPFGSNKDNLPDDKIFCMEYDKNGFLWIGTYGSGLFQFDPRSRTIVKSFYMEEEGRPDELCNNWINTLLCDESGLLWVGTYKGLSCLNPETGVFENYTVTNSELLSNTIFSLKEDKKNNIWIGTDMGTTCFSKNKQINNYAKKQGLSDNSVCGIASDENGNIWISTLTGISKIVPQDNVVVNYYASDGIQGSEFSRGAYFENADGEIFFGGTNGITRFYPRDIHTEKKELDVHITDFYLFGNRVPILDDNQLSLESGNNVFSLEFSTLEYGNPESFYYKYKLENFDNNWLQTTPGDNRVTYTNLSPGNYTLLYQACEKDNFSPVRSIQVKIMPAWYQTNWAKAIYVLIFLTICYFIYVYIRSKIEHRNDMIEREHAEQIQDAKLQFFINISHEIRTPMTLIMGPLEKLLSENKNEKIQASYLLIYRNAQRILRLINQLIDIRRIDRGQMHLKARETDMVGFVQDIMQAFGYLAKKKNIDFRFEHEMPELKVWIDLNNFDKVLFNIFSNAFKFTPDNGCIIVRLFTGHDDSVNGSLRDYFEIQVLDNGIGLEEDKIEKIFNRFYQIDNNLTNSSLGAGIGLHLARSLVELQSGVITARNRDDNSGSCFTVRLPLGNSHFGEDEIEKNTETLLSGIPSPIFYKEELLALDMDEDKISGSVKKTKYRLVIVEDDMEINNYIKAELSTDYHIVQITNGKEAIDHILANKPDIIISDIMMPGMDGISLCKKIKANVNTEHIPIILLTALSKDENRAEGLDIGADAYIVKPFNMDLLKKNVSNLLKNRERMKGKFSSRSEGKIKKIELKSSDEALMEKVIKTINDNMDNPDLNVEMLSARVGMSRVHMHRKLKELTNQSARDFIRNIRLKQAGELLIAKKLSISEVAYAVGFATLSHFSSCFKDFYGMSPKEFIENNRQERP